MTLNAIVILSVLAHRQKFLHAPFLFLGVTFVYHIFGLTSLPITLLILGNIIIAYQQFNIHIENIADGFYTHCLYSCSHPVIYIFAQFITELIITILPMFIVLMFKVELPCSFLIFIQWVTSNICLSTILSINTLNPLKILVGTFPLLTIPSIFLINFLNTQNENSLLILVGYDIMLFSIACVIFTFSKIK